MACKVLTLAQQKGGAGKTTLAAHLAVAFAGVGWRVGLLDIDPQKSLSHWFAARQQNIEAPEAISLVQAAGWRTQSEVERLKTQCDLLIIDSPPHIETEARLAIRAADLLVVPVQPSPMDLWATQPTLTMAADEKTPVLIVLNRMPPRGTLAAVVMEEIPRLGVPVAHTMIGNRISFAAALVNGFSVRETDGHSKAAEEIEALAAEIWEMLTTENEMDGDSEMRKSA